MAASSGATSDGASSSGMPELPEVETIARDLERRVTGAKVRAVRIVKHDILAPGTTAARLRRNLPGRRISDVRRRGKNLVLTFDGELRLVVNLGMTGRLVSSDSPTADRSSTTMPAASVVSTSGPRPHGGNATPRSASNPSPTTFRPPTFTR
jgi:formamidopyrimidine-DNA glycosylase